jgi:hypothetical protein
MSRSRYHALAWSFARIRGHRRAGGLKRTRRAGQGAARADLWCKGNGRRGGTAGFLASAWRSLIAIFRTGVLPRDTDI